MLQIHTYNFKNLYGQCDLQGAIMLSADKVEWLISTCLKQAGSSGYLEPGASMRLLE